MGDVEAFPDELTVGVLLQGVVGVLLRVLVPVKEGENDGDGFWDSDHDSLLVMDQEPVLE